jgi:hypothetical protein
MELKPGSGFRIGDCPIILGDTVKAERASGVRIDPGQIVTLAFNVLRFKG